MVGRPYTIEDEMDELHEELGKARRRVESLLRAPRDGRMGDRLEWEDSLANARQRVAVLERELAEHHAC
jgi:hypothetical protein